MSTDTDYMTIALELAEKGRGYTSPNPMVGAAIVKHGQIAGQGWHQEAGGAHAEVNAIADAGGQARGATMYVTLEPCNHHGRTPPCTEAILAAGITRVVCAMADPNPDVAGGGAAYLAENGVDVEIGICEARAKRLNECFIKYTATRRPFVVLKCAATLDGKIATCSGDSRWVTGEAARKHVHQLRHWLDAILVGIQTVRTDDPSLTARLEDKTGRDPIRIILDTRLSIPDDARLLRQASCAETIIAAGEQADPEKTARLRQMGARVLHLPAGDGGVDLATLVEKLGDMGITGLLVEGGSRVSGAFLSARLVDKICFFYAPKILGGEGIPICSGPGPRAMAGAKAVTDIRISHFDEDILVEGYIK
ncbi:MAG: bifunctional diaminohydroxyphosphoribosylaminopyrimidine deaminase/5-amino-6-(5-phosphoribosylamino)uracil reductase RibD [Desulfobacterales bacterium]|nr:bifunctional diaminohydroxyphosphoribosylaminopyrimidine deaminase/5-amino-6-(5-phosphoribosylamino)uracil reductase RibD [Desulfobacterales bacterium]